MGIEHELKTLTIEEYNKYKSDDRFLHNVAFAHGCLSKDMEFLHNKALCFYTIAESDFKVSEEIQEIAKKDYQDRKTDIIKSIKVNELVFVGMGMDFDPTNNNYIGNHRIRTYFKNNDGVLCFVEFGAAIDKNFLRCDHALFNTEKANTRTLKEQDEKEKRVYVLEGIRGDFKKYTKKNILKLVNDNFDTNFKDIKVYSYFLSTEDYTSISNKD